MRTRAKGRNDGTEFVQMEGNTSRDVNDRLRQAGNILYSLLIVAVAGSGMWLALALSNTNRLTEIRPALQAALAPLTAFFGDNAVALAPQVPPLITATGMITAMEELEVTSPVTAPVVSIAVTAGAHIEAGDVIAQLDDAETRRAVRNAELELANAELELQRISSPVVVAAGDTSLGEAALTQAFSNAFTSVSNAFLNAPWIIEGNRGILFGEDVNPGIQPNLYAYSDMVKQTYPDVANYRDRAASDYEAARVAYVSAREIFENTSVSSSNAEMERAMGATESFLKAAAQSLKTTGEFLAFVKAGLDDTREPPPILLEHETGVADRARTVNDNLDAIANDVAAISAARSQIAGATPEAPQGPNEIDVRDAQLRVDAAKNALADERALLPLYTIRAPVAGEIANLTIRAGAQVRQGGVIARIASPQNVARIPVIEADIGKVRVGQKTNVTFDAIPGLTIEGTVVKVDSRATVADNTVTFNIYIGFAEGEERPKPGMTATVSIPR